MKDSDQLDFLQLWLYNVPANVYWKNKDGVYLGCSRQFALSAGFDKPEDIVGKDDFELPWTDEQSHHFRRTDLMVIESEKPQIGLEQLRTNHEKKTKWIRSKKIPLYSKNGSIIGILGADEDITAQKEMELQLKARNEHLEDLNEELEKMNIVCISK